MQINGMGNSYNYSMNHGMHQVTECRHDHDASAKKQGGAAASAENAPRAQVPGYAQQESRFSLSAWWKDTLSQGKKFLRKIWGESAEGAMLHSQELAAVASARQPMQDSNPYFSAIEDTGREKQTLWEKVKVRFHSIAGQLLGRFSNKNSLNTGQQKPKEDLRKHSRYRRDDLEMDCVLTDDSYLMDSYDSKGAYRKLSPKK